jgi:hypothetical protein
VVGQVHQNTGVEKERKLFDLFVSLAITMAIIVFVIVWPGLWDKFCYRMGWATPPNADDAGELSEEEKRVLKEQRIAMRRKEAKETAERDVAAGGYSSVIITGHPRSRLGERKPEDGDAGKLSKEDRERLKALLMKEAREHTAEVMKQGGFSAVTYRGSRPTDKKPEDEQSPPEAPAE